MAGLYARQLTSIAYWPTEPVKPNRKGQTASQIPASLMSRTEDDEEDMPLLPRARKRLLGEGTRASDETSPPPTARRKAINSQSQQTASPATLRTTGRKARAPSAASEVSSVGTAGIHTRQTATKKVTRTSKKQPAVVEDSGEEEDLDAGVDFGSTRSASKNRPIPIPGATPSTLDGPTATPGTGTRTQSGMGRRRLLPADDDGDDMVGSWRSKKVSCVRADEIGV